MRVEEDIIRVIEYIPGDAKPNADGSYGSDKRTVGQMMTVDIDGVKVSMKVVRIELFHYDYGPEIKIQVEIPGFPYERPLDSIYPIKILRQRYDALYPDGDDIIEAFKK